MVAGNFISKHSINAFNTMPFESFSLYWEKKKVLSSPFFKIFVNTEFNNSTQRQKRFSVSYGRIPK